MTGAGMDNPVLLAARRLVAFQRLVAPEPSMSAGATLCDACPSNSPLGRGLFLDRRALLLVLSRVSEFAFSCEHCLHSSSLSISVLLLLRAAWAARSERDRRVRTSGHSRHPGKTGDS
jgi:hypothetical protein